MSSLGENPDGKSVPDVAAEWVLRCDRGLTAEEQDAFSEWLAADPGHGHAFARERHSWDRLASLVDWRPAHSATPNPDLLKPSRPRAWARRFILPVGLAAAAMIALVYSSRNVVATSDHSPPTTTATPALNQKTLDDGTFVILNEGAILSEQFTAHERRVTLERGEAHFRVTKDAARPFIVDAHGLHVLAVGTSFNVRLDATVAEVLVTEGRVRVSETATPGKSAAPAEKPALVPLLEAGQRAVVSLSHENAAPRIATLTLGEINRVLSWQHQMLDFSNASLTEVVFEFNRRNPTQLVIAEPELGAIRISAAFRSDNVDGFVRLIKVGFGIDAVRSPDGGIHLRKAL